MNTQESLHQALEPVSVVESTPLKEGLDKSSYWLPVIAHDLSRNLPIKTIGLYAQTFIAIAKKNPHLTFLVPELACGFCRYKPADIAPLFQGAVDVENIHLPKSFWKELSLV